MPNDPTSVDDYVARFLAEPWPLTLDQLDALAVLLRPEPERASEAEGRAA